MPIRYIANRIERFFIYRVLHVDDTPHRIALGVAIGIFVAWTPTLGFQMALAVGLAWVLRANKLVGVPFVWITNPATFAAIYGPNYLLGSWMLRWESHSWDGFLAALTSSGSWVEWIRACWSAMWDIFWPLWTGSILVGLVLGTITYFLIYYAIVGYRVKRQQRRQRRRSHLIEKAASK